MQRRTISLYPSSQTLKCNSRFHKSKDIVVCYSNPYYNEPKDLFDKLISTVVQEDGKTNYMEWSVNDKGELDLYEEDC
jgi:hypothetical protein